MPSWPFSTSHRLLSAPVCPFSPSAPARPSLHTYLRSQELCQVDLRIHARSGYVGVRRDYINSLPPGPLLLDPRGVPDVCLTFEAQEITVGVVDVVICAFLTVCIAYIGWSRLRSWTRDNGGITNGLRGNYRV